jgi:hypothetical protein
MRATVFCLTATVLAAGCAKEQPKPKIHSVAETPSSSADVYPLANGSAYLVAQFENGTEVFFLAGEASVRVVGLKAFDARADV